MMLTTLVMSAAIPTSMGPSIMSVIVRLSLVDPTTDVPYMFFVGQRYLRPLQPNIFGLGNQNPDSVAGRLLLVRESVKFPQ